MKVQSRGRLVVAALIVGSSAYHKQNDGMVMGFTPIAFKGNVVLHPGNSTK